MCSSLSSVKEQWLYQYNLYACFESGNKTRFLANKISLTPPLIIEVSVPSPGSERSCICVLVILILSPFTIFLFYLGIVPTALYFLLIRNTMCRDFDIKMVFAFYSYLFKEYIKYCSNENKMV